MGSEGIQVKHFILVFQIIIVQALEFFTALLLAAENADDRHSLNRFIDDGVDLTKPRADDGIVFGGNFAVEHNPENHNRDNEQTDQSEVNIKQEQGDINADDIDNPCAEVG